MLRWLVGLVLLGSLAWANCDQEYYPLKEGWEWQYRVTGKDPSTYSLRKTPQAEGFLQIVQGTDRERRVRYRCSSDGLVPLEYNQYDSFQTKTLSVQGLAIPKSNQWEVGASWGYSMNVEGQYTGFPPVWGEGVLEVRYRVLARENVTVPAGRFVAYKVETLTTFRLSARWGILRFPYNHEFQSLNWYAEGVGLVRQVASGNTTELIGLRR